MQTIDDNSVIYYGDTSGAPTKGNKLKNKLGTADDESNGFRKKIKNLQTVIKKSKKDTVNFWKK